LFRKFFRWVVVLLVNALLAQSAVAGGWMKRVSVSHRDVDAPLAVACTPAGLDAGLAQGGLITFNCAGPTVLILAATRQVNTNVTLDGGGKLALSGGGAVQIFNVASTKALTLRNMVLREGKASYGGAINAKTLAQINIENSDVSYNLSLSEGGAIYLDTQAGLTVRNSNFISNTALNSGGAIRMQRNSSLDIAGTLFLSNTALTGVGGVIDADTTNALLISDSALINNSSDGAITAFGNIGGGAVRLYQTSAKFTRVKFIGNKCRRVYGGAIDATFGSLQFNDVTMTDNAPGAVSSSTALLTIDGGYFARNRAGSGGALSIFDDKAILNNVQFVDNVANSTSASDVPNGSGGAIKIGSGDLVTLTNGSFTNNTANGDGGAIDNSGDLNLVNVSFSNNSAGNRGGAIFDFNDRGVSAVQSTFNNNRAKLGGAIYNWGYLYSFDTTFSNNTATDSGGAVYDYSPARFYNTTFNNNQAQYGGAIFHDNPGSGSVDLRVEDSTLSANVASISGGALYHSGTGTVLFVNATALGNTAPNGASVYAKVLGGTYGRMVFTNTVLAGAGSGANCAGNGLPITNHMWTNDVSCEPSGPGDVQGTDPKLSALGRYGGATRTHMPLAGSPLLDAGTCEGVADSDQREKPRPGTAGGKCDVGSVERGPTDTDEPLPEIKVFLPLTSR
jgi:predicted outer membrane repeat protein